MGVSVSPDFFKEEIAVAEMSMSKRAEFLTKYCNIKQNSSVAWLDYVVVDGAGIHAKLEDFKDSYAVGGIDLSQTTDFDGRFRRDRAGRRSICLRTILYASEPT